MGITGLIPFLEKASSPTNVSEFAGRTVAIDAYCWLHKGAFSCADKLARGDDCDTYVYYCMKFVNMLLSHNIKPILVFDGQKLPAKGDTEKKRKENREINRKKAAELMRLDRSREAQTYLRRCVDITHEMALNLIKACRSRNVDCIVAPYEADAQLAFFNINNIADVVITEDSDLLLFGAKKVLFKMDVNGNGLLIDQKKLHLAMGVRPESFSFDKFRYMCILSGCDYLPSLPGIGLVKACRFIVRTADPDIHRAISRMGSHLNMPQLTVTKEYRDRFMTADFMFKYQPIFDPFKKCVVPLNPLPNDGVCEEKFNELLSITNLSTEQTRQLAYGNLDPFTLVKMANWQPEQIVASKQSVCKGWNHSSLAPHPSIWSPDFKPNSWNKPKLEAPNALKSVTNNVKIIQDTSALFTKPLKRNREEDFANQNAEAVKTAVENLKCMYSSKEKSIQDEKKHKTEATSSKKIHHNPFLKTKTKVNLEQTQKNISALSQISSICKIPQNNSCSVVSRYFFSTNTSPDTNTNFACNTSPDDSDRSRIDDNLTPLLPSKETHLQRSPLKDQNMDLSPTKTPEKKKKSISTIRKKLNPFAIKDSSKSCKAMFPIKNSSKTDANSSSFKWSEKTEIFINQNIEKNNAAGEFKQTNHKVQCSEKDFKEEENEDEGFCSPSVEQNRSPVFDGSKCRSIGLTRKSIVKQKTLLSMFGYKKPAKMKL